jgi:hypothetical protein
MVGANKYGKKRRDSMRTRIRSAKVMTLSLLAMSMLIVAGCGAVSGSSASNKQPTISIASPSNGAKVRVPFTLTVSSSEPLGPTNSGKDHWHLYFDGKETQYKVITSTSTRVTNLSPGKHKLEASLQHADHSPVGPEDEISVTVVKGTGSTGNHINNGKGSGSYGY